MALKRDDLPTLPLAVNTAMGHRDEVVEHGKCSRRSQEAIVPTVACRSQGGEGLLMAYGSKQSEVFHPGVELVL